MRKIQAVLSYTAMDYISPNHTSYQHSLRELIYFNQKLLYNLMYDATSKTLIDLSKDKLGVIPRFSLVLHTWSQTMLFHLGCIGEQ